MFVPMVVTEDVCSPLGGVPVAFRFAHAYACSLVERGKLRKEPWTRTQYSVSGGIRTTDPSDQEARMQSSHNP